MKHTAKLHHLPHGIRFPQELEGKIVFDAGQRCLIWRGFMTQDELQVLLSLAADHDYRLAVANLFEGCNRLETPFTRRLNLVLAILVAVCLIGAIIILLGVGVRRSSAEHGSRSGRIVTKSIAATRTGLITHTPHRQHGGK
ncbi:MAG: hypothetical protein FJ302_13330 [Planctomycetes bacterium]|nr:hypothetical protein [Planctomycetota bacterium]